MRVRAGRIAVYRRAHRCPAGERPGQPDPARPTQWRPTISIRCPPPASSGVPSPIGGVPAGMRLPAPASDIPPHWAPGDSGLGLVRTGPLPLRPPRPHRIRIAPRRRPESGNDGSAACDPTPPGPREPGLSRLTILSPPPGDAHRTMPGPAGTRRTRRSTQSPEARPDPRDHQTFPRPGSGGGRSGQRGSTNPVCEIPRPTPFGHRVSGPPVPSPYSPMTPPADPGPASSPAWAPWCRGDIRLGGIWSLATPVAPSPIVVPFVSVA